MVNCTLIAENNPREIFAGSNEHF